MGITQGFGSDAPVRPLFAAADAKPEETLATYPDGSAAVALRETRNGWSLFVGPPGLTSELLRPPRGEPAYTCITKTDCNVYANGPYLVLHASQDGAIELDTGAGHGPRSHEYGNTWHRSKDHARAEERRDQGARYRGSRALTLLFSVSMPSADR